MLDQVVVEAGCGNVSSRVGNLIREGWMALESSRLRWQEHVEAELREYEANYCCWIGVTFDLGRW